MLRTLAHGGGVVGAHDLWATWRADWGVVLTLAVAAALYWRGFRSAPSSVRPTRVQAAAAGGAFVALVVALVSPLDTMGELLVSGHMAQHLVLMFVVAPLTVAARPWSVWRWGLPRPMRKAVARRRRSLDRYASGLATTATAAFPILAVTLWHARVPYELAATSTVWHAVQHASFVGAGVVVWVAVHRGRDGRAMGYPLLSVILVALHGVFLSALMTFSPSPWYPFYERTATAWGISPLDDQHLAGVLMWVSGSLAFLGAVVALVAGAVSGGDRSGAESPGEPEDRIGNRPAAWIELDP